MVIRYQLIGTGRSGCSLELEFGSAVNRYLSGKRTPTTDYRPQVGRLTKRARSSLRILPASFASESRARARDSSDFPWARSVADGSRKSISSIPLGTAL